MSDSRWFIVVAPGSLRLVTGFSISALRFAVGDSDPESACE